MAALTPQVISLIQNACDSPLLSYRRQWHNQVLDKALAYIRLRSAHAASNQRRHQSPEGVEQVPNISGRRIGNHVAHRLVRRSGDTQNSKAADGCTVHCDKDSTRRNKSKTGIPQSCFGDVFFGIRDHSLTKFT